ncbi:hypothetical protein [Achromobacter kerstersii]
MEQKVMKIDLANFEGPVYSGRERGETIRRQVRLDNADADAGLLVDVVVPRDAYSVTSSFFLGLFGPSIVTAGSRERFYRKFRFAAQPTILKRMDSFVVRALQRKALFG